MLTANALLLRSSLAPLDRLAASMRRVDPPNRSDRVDDRGQRRPAQPDHVVQRHAGPAGDGADRASASALAAQENERQRIARELHDEIGQTLTVALLILKRAVDRAPAEIRGELARHPGGGPRRPRRSAQHRATASPRCAGRPRPAQRAQRAVQRVHPGDRNRLSSKTLRHKQIGSSPTSSWSATASLRRA